MKKTLCFASNNAHKLEEVADVLGDSFTIQTLADIGCTDELPETTGTIPGNSAQKARYVFDHFGVACFADDSGLEVDALNGEPGVDSAFYAGGNKPGEIRSHAANIALLLKNMGDTLNRRARFRTVITLVEADDTGAPVEHQFEGIVAGTILTEPHGTGGFGYDPVFMPDGYTQTFAQMSLAEKSKISHRAKALTGLVGYLRKLKKKGL
ncbi:RdgB/HAM1 family non-canonical purine NTP pyrophosphatase [Fibrella sp. HMF5335]|uniref:dITP/XTP pyrophosphatase n=1 Tax=Fibrella rubiginis TaxID=2817060 RepID=A0A939GNC3_9BACT|nr:RdgB/HAM1 family non-canonical purine NTP pyrophosphatase [Fibrella rubiginis]MBO0939603.1 RdgB/HAM1 family non-canonical purine NTP pyrophosphatase [Fibrella rubiginis]